MSRVGQQPEGAAQTALVENGEPERYRYGVFRDGDYVRYGDVSHPIEALTALLATTREES